MYRGERGRELPHVVDRDPLVRSLARLAELCDRIVSDPQLRLLHLGV